MSNIPNGYVTFLFTDIEGSTKLAQEFYETLPDILKKHNSILHTVIEINNGFVFKTIGDAFYCAFENSADAVKAAVEVQIELSSEKWNEAVIKLRIGIHSGVTEWSGTDYMGYITLSRTQRIMSAAYGGQILISDDVYETVKDNVQNEISFRDLGERRLKDLIHPMRLYQVVSSGLREDFPPLKTLDVRPNNLPVQLTSFIGREAEMKRLKDLLNQTHLLTLTGSGGSGKTRLALQVAADVIDDFANGVWLIELASLFEPALLPQAVMKIFGLKEEPKRSPEDTLCDYLRDKEILIILDNCEHIVEPCAKLAEKLLRNSPKLKIIGTSREALRCEGEQTHRVLSLDTPNPKEELSPEKLSQYEAVRLFIERALAVNSTFRVNINNAPALAQICYQLDGIPLAIELAAARIKSLSVEQIYQRLDDRFNLLTGGKRTSLPRQQTLKALIDWSYDLLTEEEKILWRRLSVFAGGWTLEAAEEVCFDEKMKKEEVLELLNQLAEKSIIIFEREKERYRILETIRQYGEEKLKKTGELETISTNHLKFYMELSESAEPKLKEAEMQTWLEKLDAENGNLEKALLWSLEERDSEEGVRLAGALGYFWRVRGHFSAGRRWLDSVLGNSPAVTNSAHGKALNFAGELSYLQGEYDKARKLHEDSLALHHEIGDKQGIAKSLDNLGIVASDQGEFERAREFYNESLALRRDIGNKYDIAGSLNSLGNVASDQGEYERARNLHEESLAIRREIGNNHVIAISLNNLGNVAFNQGEYGRAWKLQEECLAIYRRIGDKLGIARSFSCLGNVVFNQGEYERAREFFEESLAIQRKIGHKRGIASSIRKLGTVAYIKGEYERAWKLNKESLAICREIGDKMNIAYSLNSLGNVTYNQGNYERAQKFYEESLALFRGMGDKFGIAEALIGFTGILSAGNHMSRAVMLLGAVAAAIKSMGKILDRDGQKLQEQIVNRLHEKLSDEEFSKYFEEGRKLILEQAAELALSNDQ